jgi:hypothetical protein
VVGVDIRSRPDDPRVEQLARQIFAMFPKCMRCGGTIEKFEDADVRILAHRVVHRAPCRVAGAAGNLEVG